MTVRSGPQRKIRAARGLFFLNAIIWLIFGLVTFSRMSAGDAGQRTLTLILGLLMIGNVGLLTAAGFGIMRRQARYLYFAIAVLFVNILLTITDEFGFFDLITLLIDFAILGLLLTSRQYFSSIPYQI